MKPRRVSLKHGIRIIRGNSDLLITTAANGAIRITAKRRPKGATEDHRIYTQFESSNNLLVGVMT